MVAKRSARSERVQTNGQARALVLTGPGDLRTRFARHTAAGLVSGLASLRPRPGDVPGYATCIALRELGRRAEFLDGQLGRLDELIAPLVAARAPGLLALHGVGPDTAALLLVAAGDHPERLRSEAAWAHLCAVAPLQASSGKVTRYRLNPGGDRQASHALWRIVLTRMSAHPPTLLYAGRRTKEGLPEKEIIRCLKRYVAREACRHLRADAAGHLEDVLFRARVPSSRSGTDCSEGLGAVRSNADSRSTTPIMTEMTRRPDRCGRRTANSWFSQARGAM
jgi:transposase